jgi:hypothetical protein
MASTGQPASSGGFVLADTMALGALSRKAPSTALTR